MLYDVTVFKKPSLPTEADTFPPCCKAVDFVTTLIVPPTDGIGSLEDPSPL